MESKITVATSNEVRSYLGSEIKLIESLQALAVPKKMIEYIIARMKSGRVQILDFGSFVLYVEQKK